jgi:hypothetical protein
VVYYKEIHITVVGHEREVTSKVVINNARYPVCKCPIINKFANDSLLLLRIFGVGPIAGITIMGSICWLKATSGTGRMIGAMLGTVGSFVVAHHVLRMPWRSRFRCPFAIAGLGLRYFKINFLDMFGHPFRKPFLIALSKVDSFGLQRDWWENLMPLLQVRTECVNVAK